MSLCFTANNGKELAIMLPSSSIVSLHEAYNTAGHDPSVSQPTPSSQLELLVLRQHTANFDLWHEEDLARSPDAPDSQIAGIKHSIDHLNQTRNDLVEQIDASLLEATQQSHQAAIHSETPGMMIDRLSILSLKIFHTREESVRVEASEAHRFRNMGRLQLLEEQRHDLAQALDQLWADVLAGRKRFKIYRQLKMYNDPTLNPVLYGRANTKQK